VRILASADIHGVLRVYQWLVEQSKSAEADFEDQQRQQAQFIVAILREAQVPVLYIMGNHDKCTSRYEDELIHPLHGSRIEVADFNFVGYQYTPPFSGERFVKQNNEIAADLVSFELLVDQRTVLVTHTPACGTLPLCDSGNVGSNAVSRAKAVVGPHRRA
jgi:Icc-related predicted phosphoesterase